MKRLLMLGAALAAWLSTAVVTGGEENTAKLPTVSVRKLADSLHAIIAADREAYIEQVLQPQPMFGGRARTPSRASSGSADKQDKAASGVAALPCPGVPAHAALLRAAAQKIQTGGAEFSYTLRSLTPINPNNGPQTQVEQDGLAAVAKHPDQPYYANEELGGRSYFTAVYADRAVLKSCIECHNDQPKSPRHDVKPGDVMGGIVVRVPLEF